MSNPIKMSWREILPTIAIGLTVGLLSSSCGSGESTIAGVSPVSSPFSSISEGSQEEAAVLEMTQLQTNPSELNGLVILKPLVVNGNLFRYAPGRTFTFSGSGFENVESCTFLGNLGNRSDDQPAECESVKSTFCPFDQQNCDPGTSLEVTVPDNAATGLIRVESSVDVEYRLYIAPAERPTPPRRGRQGGRRREVAALPAASQRPLGAEAR
jgi:hypothetical protein